MKNLENLENAITLNWEKYRENPDYFKKLYESMPRRLHEFIANGGGATSYEVIDCIFCKVLIIFLFVSCLSCKTFIDSNMNMIH